MTSQPNPDLPPRSAEWLINLFANAEEEILGDLSEEFLLLASQSGNAFARRWYWRQMLKSLPHLVSSGFRASPWLITAAVAAGFLLRRLVARLPEFATFSLIDRFDIYEHHFSVYRFLASTALDIEHALTFLLVGCVVGLLAKRREMPAAIALATIFGGMAVLGSVSFVIRGGDYTSLWRLSWYFTDALAVVLGGIIVRTARLKVAERIPSIS
jgi:hypothetical protein